jgi:hypothetical protein
MFSSGLIVPSTFDMPVTHTIFVLSVRRPLRSDRSSSPESVTGMYRIVAPVSFAASCHGTKLEWCSMTVERISSPGCKRRLTQA